MRPDPGFVFLLIFMSCEVLVACWFKWTSRCPRCQNRKFPEIPNENLETCENLNEVSVSWLMHLSGFVEFSTVFSHKLSNRRTVNTKRSSEKMQMRVLFSMHFSDFLGTFTIGNSETALSGHVQLRVLSDTFLEGFHWIVWWFHQVEWMCRLRFWSRPMNFHLNCES
jgi:hypothetical protein